MPEAADDRFERLHQEISDSRNLSLNVGRYLTGFDEILDDISLKNVERMLHALRRIPKFVYSSHEAQQFEKVVDHVQRRAPELTKVPEQAHSAWFTGGPGIPSNTKKTLPHENVLNMARFLHLNPNYSRLSLWTDDPNSVKNTLKRFNNFLNDEEPQPYSQEQNDYFGSTREAVDDLLKADVSGSNWKNFLSRISPFQHDALRMEKKDSRDLRIARSYLDTIGPEEYTQDSFDRTMLRESKQRKMTKSELKSKLKEAMTKMEVRDWQDVFRMPWAFPEQEKRILQSSIAARISGDSPFRYPASGKDMFIPAALAMEGGVGFDSDTTFHKGLGDLHAPLGMQCLAVTYRGALLGWAPNILAAQKSSPTVMKVLEKTTGFLMSQDRWQPGYGSPAKRKQVSFNVVDQTLHAMEDMYGDQWASLFPSSLCAFTPMRKQGDLTLKRDFAELYEPLHRVRRASFSEGGSSIEKREISSAQVSRIGPQIR